MNWQHDFCKCLDDVELKLAIQLYNHILDKNVQFHMIFNITHNIPYYDDMNIKESLPSIDNKTKKCELAESKELTLFKPERKYKKVNIDSLFMKGEDAAITYSTLCLLMFNRKNNRKKFFEYCFLCSPFMFVNYLMDLCSFVKINKVDLDFCIRHLNLISDVFRYFSEEKIPSDWEPLHEMDTGAFKENYKCSDSVAAQKEKLNKRIIMFEGDEVVKPATLALRDTTGKRDVVDILIAILKSIKLVEEIDYEKNLKRFFTDINGWLETIINNQGHTGDSLSTSMAVFAKEIEQ